MSLDPHEPAAIQTHTSVFADMFAERVLGALLSGVTIGAALLEARRYFHEKRNPLGLLYTL